MILVGSNLVLPLHMSRRHDLRSSSVEFESVESVVLKKCWYCCIGSIEMPMFHSIVITSFKVGKASLSLTVYEIPILFCKAGDDWNSSGMRFLGLRSICPRRMTVNQCFCASRFFLSNKVWKLLLKSLSQINCKSFASPYPYWCMVHHVSLSIWLRLAPNLLPSPCVCQRRLEYTLRCYYSTNIGWNIVKNQILRFSHRVKFR